MSKRITYYLLSLIFCLLGTYFFYNHNLIAGISMLATAIALFILFPMTHIVTDSSYPKFNWPVFLMVALYLFLYVSNLYNNPLIVDGDASHQAIVAQQAISESWPISGCCFKGEMSNAYLYFLGGWLKIFPGLFGLRLFSFIWGILGSFALYQLTKKIFELSGKPKNIPIYSAIIYLTIPFAQFFFHSGLELTLIIFLILSSLYFFILSWEIKKIWYLLIPTLLVGFGLYVGPQIKFWPVLIFISWLFLVSGSMEKIKIKGILKFWSITLIMLFLSALCYYPILSKLGLKQAIIGVRANQVSNLEIKPSEEQGSTSNLKQVIIDSGKSAVSFFYPVGLSGLFFIRSPYLDFIHSFLLLLGWISIFFVNKRVALYLTVWYILGAIIAGGFTVGSPTSSRMIINLPVVVILIACGVSQLETIGVLLKNKRKSTISIVVLLTLFVYGWWTTNHYFTKELIDNTNQNDYISSTVGRYLAEDNFSNKNIYMLSSNNYYYNAILSLRFLSNRYGVDIPETEQPNLIRKLQETENNVVIVPFWYQSFIEEIQVSSVNNLSIKRIDQIDGYPSSFIIAN